MTVIILQQKCLPVVANKIPSKGFGYTHSITNLESFQKDFWSSRGTTRVAFKIRAATTASIICKSVQ
jgi:hypothetical protein